MSQAAEAGPNRGTRRRERTRAALIAATRRLLADRAIDAIPIAEITDAADVAVGSFYNHFSSREALLEAVVADTLEAHNAALDRTTSGMSDVAEILASRVRLTVRAARRDPVWGWFLMRVGPYIPMVWESLGPRMARDLTAGFETGRFSRMDLHTTRAAIAGAVFGVIQAELIHDVSEDADLLLADALLRMLGVPSREAAEIASRPLPAAESGREA